MQVEFALEQHRQDLERRMRPHRARRHHVGEPVGVVVLQLVDARVQPAERLAVGRQHQRVGGQATHAFDRREVERQRIGLGLQVDHADVGRDARQHHVTRDQQAQRFAVQADVLGRVAVAGVAGPDVAAHRQPLPFHHPAELARHVRHHARVVVAAVAHLVERGRVGHAVAAEERRRCVAAETGGLDRRHARRVPVRHADPQPAWPLGRAPVFGQPARQADVVRVHVGDDDAQHGQAVEFLGKDALPRGAGGVVGDAAVHDGPALAAVEFVAHQPEVDVVQRERQPHAQPAHPGGDLQRVTTRGQRVAQHIGEFVFLRVRHGGSGGWTG